MIALAVVSLLLVQDPSGDAFGNGTLTAPTAALYQTLSTYDITGLELLSEPALGLNIAFASLANPLELDNGFSFPIIEIYIGDDTPGSSALLPGSGMRLPKNATWHYALKLTGDKAQLFIAEGETVLELGAPSVTKIGNTLSVKTDLVAPEKAVLYAIAGSYSPFSKTGWQALSVNPSPWAFSSAEQSYPVVDILTKSEVAQVRALETGVLPSVKPAALPPLPKVNVWLWLMGTGLLVSVAGVISRFTLVSAPTYPKIQGVEDLYFTAREAAGLKEVPVTEIAGALPEMLDNLFDRDSKPFSDDDEWLDAADEDGLSVWRDDNAAAPSPMPDPDIKIRIVPRE